MSFLDETSSFFDELGQIVSSQKKERETDMQRTGERPFSSELTQDEEPTTPYNPSPVESEEPQVISRVGGG
jgi:hypothetical protein